MGHTNSSSMKKFFASSVYIKKLEKKTQINDMLHN